MATGAKLLKHNTLKQYLIKQVNVKPDKKLSNQFKKGDMTALLLTGNETAILLTNISAQIENQEID